MAPSIAAYLCYLFPSVFFTTHSTCLAYLLNDDKAQTRADARMRARAKTRKVVSQCFRSLNRHVWLRGFCVLTACLLRSMRYSCAILACYLRVTRSVLFETKISRSRWTQFFKEEKNHTKRKSLFANIMGDGRVILFEGHLKKKPEKGLVRLWKHRFFLLKDNAQLYYFLNKVYFFVYLH